MKNFLALSCLLLSVAVAGCTDAGKCERGTENCAVRENVAASERCEDGLVVRDGFCVEDENSGGRDGGTAGRGGTGGRAGGGGSGGGGGGSGGSGGADAGGGDPEPIDCSADSLEEGCMLFCEAFCRNEQSFCVNSDCPAGACEPGGELFDSCADACETESDPTACAVSLCEGQNTYVCEDFGFLDEETEVYISGCLRDDPICVQNADYGCSDVCGTTSTAFGGVGADLVGDGVCQDGGPGSMASPGSTATACARGTDCTDCGVRTCVPVGEGCDSHGDCCGFYDVGTLCVELQTGPTCLANCTETGRCPNGQRCVETDDNRNSVCAP